MKITKMLLFLFYVRFQHLLRLMVDGQNGQIGAHALRVYLPSGTAPGHVQILHLRLVASNAADIPTRWRFVLKTVQVRTLFFKKFVWFSGPAMLDKGRTMPTWKITVEMILTIWSFCIIFTVHLMGIKSKPSNTRLLEVNHYKSSIG